MNTYIYIYICICPVVDLDGRGGRAQGGLQNVADCDFNIEINRQLIISSTLK